MFPLLELPLELLEHVVAVIHPRDIESLSRCGSRLIRDLTKKSRIEHYKLKGKYTCIRLCGERHSYPKYVSLGSYSPIKNSTHGLWTNYRAVHERYWSDIISDVTAFVGSLDIAIDVKRAWVDAICSPQNKSAAVALVLSLLTDVKVVKMEQWRIDVRELDPLWTIVTHIAMNNRNSSNLGESSMSERPLSRLQKFSIEGSPVVHNTIDVFVPFASLPSILDLHGVYIFDRIQNGGSSAWQWPIGFPDRGSSVTSIHLHNSSVGVSTFESFLGGIAALREFAYQHDQYLSTAASQWDPSGIVAVLRRYAVDSLTSLNLTTRPERVMARTKDVQEEFVGSLQMFAALKYIRMDDRLLAGPEWAVSHLVDVLPRTVEYLTLIPDPWWKAREQSWGAVSPQNERLRGLFRDFPKLRKQRLPELQKVVIENYRPVDDLRDSLRAVEGVCASLKCEPLFWMQSNTYFIEYTISPEVRREVSYWPPTWPRRVREWDEDEWKWEY